VIGLTIILGKVIASANIAAANIHTATNPALSMNNADAVKSEGLGARTRAQIRVVSVTTMIESTGPSALNIRYDVPTMTVPTISRSQAVAIAEDAMGVMMDKATSIKIQLVRWSKDDDYSTGAQGQKQYVYQNVNAWVLVFEGAAFPSQGPYGSRPSSNQEENVAVDAMTGKLLGFYTYQ